MTTTNAASERWGRLGAVIRQHRRAQGLSRIQLARAAGISQRTLESYERGYVPARPHIVPMGHVAVGTALGWTPDSVRRVLEGGEPRVRPDFLLGEATAAAGQPARPLVMPVERRRALSRELLELLPKVLRFSRVCATLGAHTDKQIAFQKSVQGLLGDARVDATVSRRG
jgi:transcriptional regulator with XRE-family HTH domain